MSAPDPTVKTPDATANSGCGAMPCSASLCPETDAEARSLKWWSNMVVLDPWVRLVEAKFASGLEEQRDHWKNMAESGSRAPSCSASSETPETDEVAEWSGDELSYAERVPADYARKLESERNGAIEWIDLIVGLLPVLCDHMGVTSDFEIEVKQKISGEVKIVLFSEVLEKLAGFLSQNTTGDERRDPRSTKTMYQQS